MIGFFLHRSAVTVPAFSCRDLFTQFGEEWKNGRPEKCSCDVSSRCRLCGETTARKFYFFSDNGKSIQLKRIVSKVCEVLVDGTDELPKFCCRSCYDKVLRLNKNIEALTEVCRKTQKELEAQLRKKRTRTDGTPVSSEKPRKQVKTKEAITAKKSLFKTETSYSNDTSFQYKYDGYCQGGRKGGRPYFNSWYFLNAKCSKFRAS